MRGERAMAGAGVFGGGDERWRWRGCRSWCCLFSCCRFRTGAAGRALGPRGLHLARAKTFHLCHPPSTHTFKPLLYPSTLRIVFTAQESLVLLPDNTFVRTGRHGNLIAWKRARISTALHRTISSGLARASMVSPRGFRTTLSSTSSTLSTPSSLPTHKYGKDYEPLRPQRTCYAKSS